MTARQIDLDDWPFAERFRFFRDFDRPHFAATARIDVTRIMEAKAVGLSPYRACLFAIGCGIHAVPELRLRFRGDTIVQHDAVELSMTVPRDGGGFSYAYVPFDVAFAEFDRAAAAGIAAARSGSLRPNEGGRDDLAYLSCLPWLDYTSLDNAMPGPDDCIPRVSWGKIVALRDGGHDVAMTLQVHHALVDGAHVGAFFAAVQEACDGFG